MNPSDVPDSGIFDILDMGRECEDNDEYQYVATIDDNTCANLDESGKRNPPDIKDTPKMVSPSGIEGREA